MHRLEAAFSTSSCPGPNEAPATAEASCCGTSLHGSRLTGAPAAAAGDVGAAAVVGAAAAEVGAVDCVRFGPGFDLLHAATITASSAAAPMIRIDLICFSLLVGRSLGPRHAGAPQNALEGNAGSLGRLADRRDWTLEQAQDDFVVDDDH